MIKKLATLIIKNPFVSFVILAYAFSWWMWPLYVLDLSPAAIAGFGPFLGAVVVLGFTVGRAGVKDLLRQMMHWRVGLRWYAIALGLPIIITGFAAFINIELGAPAPSAQQVAQWPSLVSTFLMLLLIPGIGGAWEEPGWRGFALPWLVDGRSQLWASILLAPMIAGWHLPLFLMGIIPWADLLYLLGTVVIFNWVYYRADRSVLIIMIFHAMNNAVGQYFPSFFSETFQSSLALIQGVVCLVIALIILITQWRFWTKQSEIKHPERPQLAG